MSVSTLAIRILICQALAGLLVTRPANAQSAAQATAEASFSEGVRLMKQDRYAEAVGRFQASDRLDPASGTLLDLGYCQAHLGRLASAWLTYRRAVALARAQGKADHERIAREQAEQLEPQVPYLTIIRPSLLAPGARIELDGEVVTASMWSLPIPVDPGLHRVRAERPPLAAWEKAITVGAGERVTVDVGEAPEPPRVESPAERPRPRVALPLRAPLAIPSTDEASGRPTWALAVAATGAVTLLAGGAVFLSARLGYDSARAQCSDDNRCLNGPYEDERSAITRSKIALGLLAGGAVLGGIGAVFYFGGSHQAGRPPTIAALGLAGLVLHTGPTP